MIASHAKMEIERDEQQQFEGEANLDRMAQQVENPFTF